MPVFYLEPNSSAGTHRSSPKCVLSDLKWALPNVRSQQNVSVSVWFHFLLSVKFTKSANEKQ